MQTKAKGKPGGTTVAKRPGPTLGPPFTRRRNAALARAVKQAEKSIGSATKGVSRLAVSFDPGLASRIQEAASSSTGGNVSAWLAEAAQARLRQEALADVLRELEETNGKVSSEEILKVRTEWLG